MIHVLILLGLAQEVILPRAWAKGDNADAESGDVLQMSAELDAAKVASKSTRAA